MSIFNEYVFTEEETELEKAFMAGYNSGRDTTRGELYRKYHIRIFERWYGGTIK